MLSWLHLQEPFLLVLHPISSRKCHLTILSWSKHLLAQFSTFANTHSPPSLIRRCWVKLWFFSFMNLNIIAFRPYRLLVILFLQNGRGWHNDITRLGCATKTRVVLSSAYTLEKGLPTQIRILDNLDYDTRAGGKRQRGEHNSPPPFRSQALVVLADSRAYTGENIISLAETWNLNKKVLRLI